MNFLLKWIRRLLRWAMLIVFILVGAWIAYENASPMKLTLFGWNFPEWTTGIYVALLLLLGFIVGVLSLAIVRMPAKLEDRRTIQKQRAEIKELRHNLVLGDTSAQK